MPGLLKFHTVQLESVDCQLLLNINTPALFGGEYVQNDGIAKNDNYDAGETNINEQQNQKGFVKIWNLS